MAKLCWAKCVAQKARREAEKKAYEEAERQKVAEEKERKKKMVEYLQWLQDKVSEEEAALLERAEGSQVVGPKCKKVTARDKERQQPFKKAKRKYCRDTTVKMEGFNLCERYVCARQDCLVYPSR